MVGINEKMITNDILHLPICQYANMVVFQYKPWDFWSAFVSFFL